jgi:hypothetical protein
LNGLPKHDDLTVEGAKKHYWLSNDEVSSCHLLSCR